MKKTRSFRFLSGFTLTELLVVLIIMGILVLLALPNLMPLISKAKSTEAQLQLSHVHMLEKTYFYLHSTYSDNLAEIGFEQESLSTEGGKANYKIEIVEATNTGFKAKAISLVDFDNDGIFNDVLTPQIAGHNLKNKLGLIKFGNYDNNKKKIYT